MIGIRTVTRTALALTAAAAVSGCNNFLDVNEDPNNPQSVAMELSAPVVEEDETEICCEYCQQLLQRLEEAEEVRTSQKQAAEEGCFLLQLLKPWPAAIPEQRRVAAELQ